tara:strand:- start:28793 stop:28894 length:102 start_codon:yes stop_codon:yes gene_type:complete
MLITLYPIFAKALLADPSLSFLAEKDSALNKVK